MKTIIETIYKHRHNDHYHHHDHDHHYDYHKHHLYHLIAQKLSHGQKQTFTNIIIDDHDVQEGRQIPLCKFCPKGGGTPQQCTRYPPPFADFSQKKILKKAKDCVLFSQKHLLLVKQIGY